MKALVTGAAGFIGMHVARRLLARGDAVVGLDNIDERGDAQLKQARLALLLPDAGFSFVRQDVADCSGMDALFACQRFDRVVQSPGTNKRPTVSSG